MDAVELVFLGTIHRQHLCHEAYHLGHLKAALLQARFELLMVEVRPGPFRRGDIADGPHEMTYLTELASAADIPVAPVDWFCDDHPEAKVDKARLENLEADLRALKPPRGHAWPLDYRQCHDMDHLRHLQALHHVRVRHLGDQGHGDWLRRALWIAHDVEQALQAFQPRRALMAVGVDHVADLWDLLGSHPNIECRLSGPIEPMAAEDYSANAQQLAAWQKGIAYLRRKQARAQPDSALHQKLAQKIADWQRAVDQRGVVALDTTAENRKGD